MALLENSERNYANEARNISLCLYIDGCRILHTCYNLKPKKQ